MTINLEGRWFSEWAESEDKWVPGFMELRHKGQGQIEGEDRAEGVAYHLEATIKGNTVTGSWRGEGRIEGYSGNFELTIEDGGRRLEGSYTTDGEPYRLRYWATKIAVQ